MVWSCDKGNGGRSVVISGRNGSIGEKESRKTKEYLERYSEGGFGTNMEWMRVWHWIAEDGERSSQVQPLLKWKIWTLNENDDDDDDDIHLG